MRCPGQDSRYWGEDAAFEVPCPKCGSEVEIFKDETKGRCGACGHRFQNPKVDLKCAQWCAYAEACLGIAPSKDAPSANLGEGALAGRLIRAVKDEFQGDQPGITRALVAFQHAKDLASKEGGDPRIVMAAALLLDVGRPKSGDDPVGDLSRLNTLLQEAGFDEAAILTVGQIVTACRRNTKLGFLEFDLVSDTNALVDLSSRGSEMDSDDLKEIVDNRLITASAKKRANEFFRS